MCSYLLCYFAFCFVIFFFFFFFFSSRRRHTRSLCDWSSDVCSSDLSGGHAGLRVGDDVFHFEYRRPGILVLRRETFDEFRREYTGLENRTIEASRIPVGEATFRLVRERFRRRHLVQRRQLEVFDTLRADRRILEEMLQGGVELDGAGFFVGEGAAADPALLGLRR